MSPTLPQELVDHVIDLNADHVVALHASALVSRSWTTRAHRHLFRTITITFHKPKTLVNLASVFRTSSFLASHVQTVSFTGNTKSSLVTFPLESLKSLLDSIGAAREIIFMDIAYSMLLQTVQDYILAFLSTPSIHSLTDIFWQPSSPFSSSRTIPLENLEFRGYFLISFTNFLREPHCPLDIQLLTSLRLSGPYFIKELNKLFPRIAALNHLTINFPSYTPSGRFYWYLACPPLELITLLDVLELDRCPQLQTLTFMVDHPLLTDVETFFETIFSAEYGTDSLNIVSFSFGPSAINLEEDLNIGRVS